MGRIFLWLLVFLSSGAWAASAGEFIFEQATGRRLTVNEFTALDHSGEVIVFGETHATDDDPESPTHQGHQVQLLQALSNQAIQNNRRLSVGMEFLNYTTQHSVDLYLDGEIGENEFLSSVDWGRTPFGFYRDQILLPVQSGGSTRAINMPREVTSQVARGGLDSLSDWQKGLLPPGLERGNEAYFERFKESMGGHGDDIMVENYFWAMSIWDDTMAWQTNSYVTLNPLDTFVIIVGIFHVEYGGGLPDRLRARGVGRVKTLMQIKLDDKSEDAIQKALAPHPKYGAQADYIWIY